MFSSAFHASASAHASVSSSTSFPRFRPALLPVSVMAAWACACVSAAHAQSTLPEVHVQSTRTVDSALGLSNSAKSGANVDVPVQDVPASVSTVSSQQMDERADFEVADAVTRTVGLSVDSTPGNGGLAFSSRGFAGVNSVGVAEDGMMLGVASGTINYPSDAWGYERIDVLRGPASIVYGSGTMGGTVNAMRKQPSRERSTDLLVGAGSHGEMRLGFGMTGAISETLSYRIDAYGQRRNGERELGKSSSQKLMTGLRWQPRADLKVDLTADIAEQKPERYFGTPAIDGQLVRSLRNTNYNVQDSDIQYKDKRVRAKAEWTASDLLTLRDELYWFKADRHWRNAEMYSFDPRSGVVTRGDYLEIGHDLEQKGNRVGADLKLADHRIAIGWDFSEARYTNISNSPYSTPSNDLSAWNPEHGSWTSPDPYLARSKTQLRQHALYLEDAWQVSKQWLLMAGLRRDWYDFDQRNLITGTTAATDLSGTSWRVGATYKLSERSSLYAQLSRGHDPVGSLVSLSASQTAFKLTRGRQAEIGWKQQLPDERGELTLAAFDITKSDIITRDPLRPALSVQGGKQSSRGVELSAAYKVNAALRVDGNVAYVKAKFDEFREGSTGADRAGNRPANVPSTTANLWGHYRIGAWQTSLGLRHVGSRYSNNANTSQLPRYTVADAVLRWDMSKTTALSLVVRNLTNRVYATSSYYDDQWLVAPGRSVALTGQFRF
ncbi:TonB-dependent siderophore receptor [Diaphorobacter sp. HDW4B]|uniref:TonB-dependent receptor n=1 Tax=Diaphorobacter sp. HDW4B TaxID=2714925 RepID=UPI00140B7DC0|nr:TonB-dependent siderophore receptor [Diaphorobacter sp. HDW4B]QIL71599.1 TonB-dependent siderophore receptor [Diaphorobacter sp. HDW4B]